MRGHNKWVAAIAALVAVALATAVPAAESLDSIIKKVDAKLYYPQDFGLRSLQADVQSSWLNEQLKIYPQAAKAKLRFYWAAPYRHRFHLSGIPDSLSYEARDLERQLAMWGNWLVPKPLAVSLATYKCTLKEDEKSYIIDARTTEPSAFIWSAQYTIDKKTLIPTKMFLGTTSWDADITMRYYSPVPGKYLPIEMKAAADGNTATIKLTYRKVGKWTLTDSLSLTFMGSSGTEETVTLRLSNFKLNQPIPAGIFPAAKR